MCIIMEDNTISTGYYNSITSCKAASNNVSPHLKQNGSKVKSQVRLTSLGTCLWRHGDS